MSDTYICTSVVVTLLINISNPPLSKTSRGLKHVAAYGVNRVVLISVGFLRNIVSSVHGHGRDKGGTYSYQCRSKC